MKLRILFLALISTSGVLGSALPGGVDDVRETNAQATNRLVFAHFMVRPEKEEAGRMFESTNSSF